jgi:alcohol dehydrogenase class IV
VSPTAFKHATPAFRTFCGPDALTALPRELDRVGAQRAAIICSASIAGQHRSAFEAVVSAVGERLAGQFTEVRAHTPLQCVDAARQFLREINADAVLVIGGGSAVVTARAATILLAEDGDVHDLCTRRESDGRFVSPRLMAPKLPQWIIPSTPTTAYAKAGAAARDAETGGRLPLFDPKARAQGIFIDPTIALTAPVGLACGAALDTLTLTVEALQTAIVDPLAEAMLLHSLRLLKQWLPRLTHEPDDPEPRIQLMLAALLCGQGTDFAGGGLAAALAHAANPQATAVNGAVQAVLLPHTMRYNAPVTAERMAGIASVLNPRAVPPYDPVDAAVSEVQSLIAATRTPTRLRDTGVSQAGLPGIVGHAADDWALLFTPRPPSRNHLLQLLQTAW